MELEVAIAVIGLVFGLYGAILSTLLALRERQKDKRRVRVILEYVRFVERLQLTIINVGFRPVTITGVSIASSGESIPANAIFDEQSPFPVVLEDGQHITVALSRNLSVSWGDKKPPLDIKVYDAEGIVYRHDSLRFFDAKWGTYTEIQ